MAAQAWNTPIRTTDGGDGIPAHASDSSDGGRDFRGSVAADPDLVENDGLQYVGTFGGSRGSDADRSGSARDALRRRHEPARTFLLYGLRKVARRLFRPGTAATNARNRRGRGGRRTHSTYLL